MQVKNPFGSSEFSELCAISTRNFIKYFAISMSAHTQTHVRTHNTHTWTCTCVHVVSEAVRQTATTELAWQRLVSASVSISAQLNSTRCECLCVCCEIRDNVTYTHTLLSVISIHAHVSFKGKQLEIQLKFNNFSLKQSRLRRICFYGK